MTISSQIALKSYADCGVYIITHIASGKAYVGSSSCIIKRKSRHLTSLEKNNHPNQHLQSAYNKYGSDAFTFKTIIVCAPEDRIFHEQRLIDQCQSSDRKFGYNASSIAGVTEITEEVRFKMRMAKLGKPPSNKGIPRSEETKKKIGQANKGNIAWNKGKPWSNEIKKKLSDSHLGFVMPEAQKRKISESHKARFAKMRADNS